MGGATVNNLTMGLGLKTNIAFGLIGIGYRVNEASVETVDETYPNLPIALYEAGYTNTVAFSLWLNDLSANAGSILFGGIDTKKYTGNLTRLEIQPDDGVYTHFTVTMTSLVASSSSGTDTLTSDELPIGVVLDSGTTLSYLPDDMASQVWNEVGAYYDSNYGLAVLPCSYATHEGTFTFGFGGSDGPEIVVAMDELVIDLTNGNQPEFSSGEYKGELVCEFGIQNYTSSIYLLGNSFLRSAYVVYDLVNNEIGLAQTDFNATESNVVAFKSKGAVIPSSTAAPNQNQTIEGSEATSTNLSAADGFQDENDDDSSAASTLTACGSSLMVAGITIAFMFVGGGAFSSNLA
ncbi:aspartic peptidase domain-containing protein [Dactylonectria estremocensis]|uniref:Aspartic peptidase domain-containing protein n=1 Tax=Dactylonectria estremocensis TaxID=1079267 RepID=A0A9P9IWN2_9HYPO|nr:aspartic peptidase domain-containing protein [Dactylonectria estremocensis]